MVEVVVIVNNFYYIYVSSSNNYVYIIGVKSREVNGRLVLEGVLRLHWGIHSVIQLKEDDDQRLPSSSSSTSNKFQRKVVSSNFDYQVMFVLYYEPYSVILNFFPSIECKHIFTG